MAKVEGKKQVGAYIDKDLWEKFREKIFKKTGKLKISKHLEEAIKLWLEEED